MPYLQMLKSQRLRLQATTKVIPECPVRIIPKQERQVFRTSAKRTGQVMRSIIPPENGQMPLSEISR